MSQRTNSSSGWESAIGGATSARRTVNPCAANCLQTSCPALPEAPVTRTRIVHILSYCTIDSLKEQPASIDAS